VRPQAAANLETVQLGSIRSSTTRSTCFRLEAPQGLLAVAGVQDAEALVLEWIREQLLHGVLVVDEEDRGGVARGRFTWKVGACRSVVLL